MATSLSLSPLQRELCSHVVERKGAKDRKTEIEGERERETEKTELGLALSLSLSVSLSLSLFLSLCLLIKETDRKELLLPYVERRGPPQVDLRRLLQADSNAKEFLSAR